MPIYEFRCTKCEELFELLILGRDENTETACPKCQSEEFERVMSTTNYAMHGGTPGGSSSGVQSQSRTCSGGSCTTYEIPGPK